MRYKLPKELGEGEYEAMFDSGVSASTALNVNGRKVIVPTDMLTPVKPPLPEEPEPDGEFFVMDFPGRKIVPRMLVQNSSLGWVFVGGNARGGPYTWQQLRARYPHGVLTALVRANAAEKELAGKDES